MNKLDIIEDALSGLAAVVRSANADVGMNWGIKFSPMMSALYKVDIALEAIEQLRSFKGESNV